MSSDPLIGRSREIASLTTAIMSARDRGSVLLLVGEPGIGKSALLAEARRAALSAGRRVLEAAGVEGEMHLPFGAVQQLLSPIIDDMATLSSAQRGAIQTVFGLAEGSAPDLFLIAEAAFSLLVRERANNPLVISVDDLQWLDPQSHQIVTFLAHRASTSGFCVLGAVRADHPGPFVNAGFPELVVRGVDDDAAEALLNMHAGDLSTSARKRIRRESEGNPLALLELPHAWIDEPPTDDRPVPLSVRLERAFAGRVSELPDATRDALLIAAIESSSDALEICGALSALGSSRTSLDVFNPAVCAGLLREVSTTVEFRHPLVRAGVLRREPLTRKHAAHHALAEVLTSDAYRRTWHRAWSMIGPDDEAADELSDTVPDLIRHGAAMAAVSSLERSAQLTSTSTVRGGRLIQAAQVAFSAGRADVVARILREVSVVDLTGLDQARLTWLREALNGDVTSDPGTVRALCDSASRANDLGDTGLALDLLVSAALRCWWAETVDDGRARLLSVLDGLRDVQDDPRQTAARALTQPVLRASEVTTALRSVKLTEANDGEQLRTYGMTAYAVGDLPLATDLLDRAEQRFREEGRLGDLPVVLALQLHIRLELGDWAGAAAASDEVNKVSIETGQPIFAVNNVFIEARARALRGEWQLALDQIVDAESEAKRQKVNDRVCLAYQARGTALLSANRTDEAFDCLKRQFDPLDVGYHLRESFSGVALMAEAALDCGRLSEARGIFGALEATALLTPSPLLQVNLLYARAALAPHREREDKYREALQRDLTRWPWIRARIQLEYGRLLVRMGRRAEGAVQLIAARVVFDRIGARRWSGRAVDALDLSAPGTRSPDSAS